MYLVDSNTWLESLLQRDRHRESDGFLKAFPARELAITDFSLFSIGIASSKKTPEVYSGFLRDISAGGVKVIRLAVPDLLEVVSCRTRFNLDFDDAYQYFAAEKHGLTIVSFDSDFDRTPRGRKTPGEILAQRPA